MFVGEVSTRVCRMWIFAAQNTEMKAEPGNEGAKDELVCHRPRWRMPSFLALTQNRSI